MSDLHAEIQLERAFADAGSGPFAGTVAETAPDTETKISVLVDAFDPALRFGPCAWMPRVRTVTVDVSEAPETVHNVDVAQTVLPSRGDRCLVAFDDSDTPWIVGWWPS